MTGPEGPVHHGVPGRIEPSGVPEHVSVGIANPLQAMADRIVGRHRQECPDLSRLTLVVPSVLLATDLARCLSRAARQDTLLLPRITTFASLAREAPVAGEPVPDSRRELVLYDVLRRQGLVDRVNLWSAARELRRLIDELTSFEVPLATSVEEFSTLVERAYGARTRAAIRFEARVVYEAWRHLTGEQDAAYRYQAGLAHAAARASGPLYVLDAGDMRPVEAAFARAWAARGPVCLVNASSRPDAGQAGVPGILSAAWPETPDPSAPLRTRAAALRATLPSSALAERLALFGAPTLEAHAAAAELRIRAWLAEGVGRIAVVAVDRVAARRLRALLERAGILVQDETGWALSTVAAATVVARWLDCTGDRFHHRDLLDLLKSPYVLSDMGAEGRKHFVWRVETLLRKANLVRGLDALAAIASDEPDARELLAGIDRLRGAAAAMPRGDESPGRWVGDLTDALETLGIVAGLGEDAAGQQVLEHLQRLRDEVAGSHVRLDFGEFRRWLDGELESALFRDRDIRSPVVFTHLHATRLRTFDAVLVLGADMRSLPGKGLPGAFLNDAVRRELGLPGRAEQVARERETLAMLIASAGRAFVTWQNRQDSEPVAASPWLDVLDTLHREAYGAGLRTDDWGRLVGAAALRPANPAPLPSPAGPPAPSAPMLIPEDVSVSAYGTMIGCPYRFYASHALRLDDLDEIRDEIEKRDYGDLLHRVLHAFHREVPRVSDLDRDAAEARLVRITDDVFGRAATRNHLAHAWAQRWRKCIGAYLDFQCAREAQGWAWLDGEVRSEVAIDLPGSRVVRLRGRLDRVDARPEASGRSLAVLDYKTSDKRKLRARLDDGDDVQLRSYLLLRGDAEHAAYVTIDNTAVDCVDVPGDAVGEAAREVGRLRAVFTAALDGAGLPANGSEETCRWCAMRALCRRDYWSDA
ncbi:MAG: Inactivated superfamily I helicase [Betaproteobacteria bacterium]|nr:Inactivated superfamily I helicase [Betaproteobacteria bacterium]